MKRVRAIVEALHEPKSVRTRFLVGTTGSETTDLDQRELDLRDRPRAAGLYIFDFQHAALRPADEAAALRVRHPCQGAVLRDRGFDFHGALEPSGSAFAVRGDLDRVRLPGVIRRD